MTAAERAKWRARLSVRVALLRAAEARVAAAIKVADAARAASSKARAKVRVEQATLAVRVDQVAEAERALSDASTLSDDGLKLIAEFEGFVPRPYNDPAGHATIGYGHLLHHGAVTSADQRKWRTITPERGREILRQDVARFEEAVNRLVEVPLTQGQFDALVSFAFNVGEGALADSTLLRELNAGDYSGAAAEFGRWVYAGGERLDGLVRRRLAERARFLS